MAALGPGGGGLHLPAIVEVKVTGLDKAARDMDRFGYRVQAQARTAIAQPAGPAPPKALPPGATMQPGAQQFKAIGMGADPYGFKQSARDLNDIRSKHAAFQARLAQSGRTQDFFNTKKAQQDLTDLRQASRATRQALESGPIPQPRGQQFKAIGVGADPHGFKQSARDLNELQAKFNAFQARLGQRGRDQDLFNTQKAKQDLADLRRRKQELDQGGGLEVFRQQARTRPSPIPGQQALGEGDVLRSYAGPRPSRPSGEIGAGGRREIGAGAGGGAGAGAGGGGGGWGSGGGPGGGGFGGALGMDAIDRAIKDMVKWAKRNAELYRRMALNNQGILDAQADLKVQAAKYRAAYAQKFDVGTPEGKERTAALAQADYATRQRKLGQSAMESELNLGRPASSNVWKSLEAGGVQREAATKLLKEQVARETSIAQSKLALEEGTAKQIAEEKVLRDRLNREIAAQVRAQTDKKGVAQDTAAKRRDAVEQERENRRAVTPEDRATEAVNTTEKRLASAEQRLANQVEMRTANGQKVLAAEAALAAQEAELKAQQAKLAAGDARLIRATAESANAEEQRAAKLTLARAGKQFEGLSSADTLARSAVAANTQAIQRRTDVIRATTDADRQALATQKLAAAKERIRMRDVEKQVFAQAVESGEAGRGTWFQRVQSRMQPFSGKLPEEQLTGRQYVAARTQTMAGYAIGGAAIGLGTAALAEMFKDASELEQSFVRLRGQMEGIGKVDSFPRVRNEIKAIASETGQASNQVAIFYSRMLGLSGDPESALTDTASAMKLATVTGLDMKTMMQSLVPIQKSFGLGAEEIGDEIVAMGEKFGIAEDDLVQFLGKTASVAKNAGLSFKELTTIGATVANSLGRPIDASAEAINKSFGQIEANADKIFQILAANPSTKGFIPSMIEAMGKGETGGALIELLKASQSFDPGQRNAILKNVVSRREAEEFNALISNAGSILEQLGQQQGGAADSTGKLNQRFGDLKSTVATTFKSLAAAFESIGDAIFQSGIADFLVDLGRLLGTVVAVAGAVVKVFGVLNELLGGQFGVPVLSTFLKIAAVSGVLIKLGDVVTDQKNKRIGTNKGELASEKANENQIRSSATTNTYFTSTKQASMNASVEESAAESANTAVKQNLSRAATETAAAESALARAKLASAEASRAALMQGVQRGGPLALGPGPLGLGPGPRGIGPAPLGLGPGPRGVGPGPLGLDSGMLGLQAGLLGLGSGRMNIGSARYSRAGGLSSGMLGLSSGMLGLPAGRGGLVPFGPQPELGGGRIRTGPATYSRQALAWGPYAGAAPLNPRMLTQAQKAMALPIGEAAALTAGRAGEQIKRRMSGDAGGFLRMGGYGRPGWWPGGDAGGSMGMGGAAAGARMDYAAEAFLRKRRIDTWATELAPGAGSRLAQRRLIGYDAQRTLAQQHFAGRMAAGETITSGLGTRALAGGGLLGGTFKSAKADAQIAASGDKALSASPFAVGAVIAAGIMAVQSSYEKQATEVKNSVGIAKAAFRRADKKTLDSYANYRSDWWDQIQAAMFDTQTMEQMIKDETSFERSTEARKNLGFKTRPVRTAMDETKKAQDDATRATYKKMYESITPEAQQGIVDELGATTEGRRELQAAGMIERKLPKIDIVPKLEGFWGTATKFGGPGMLGVIQEKYNDIGNVVGAEVKNSADGYTNLMMNLRGRDDETSNKAAEAIDKWQQGGMKEGDRPDFDRMAKELAHSGNVIGAIEAAGGNVEGVLGTLDKSGDDQFRSLDELAKLYQAGKITAAEYKTEADKALGYVQLEAQHFQGEMGAKARGVVIDTTNAVNDAMLRTRQTAENVALAFAQRGSVTPKAVQRASIERMMTGQSRQTRLDNLQNMVTANIEATDEAIAGVYDPAERTKAFAAGVRLDDTAYQTRLQAEMGSSAELDPIIKKIATSLGMEPEQVSNAITERAAKTGVGLVQAADDFMAEQIGKLKPAGLTNLFTIKSLEESRGALAGALTKIPDIRTDLPDADKVALQGIKDEASARTAEAKVAATRFQGDDLQTTAQNTKLAYAAWTDLMKGSMIPNSGITKEMVQEGEAAYLSAQRTERDSIFGYEQLKRNRAVLFAKGDPVKATSAQIDIARAELSEGRKYGDKKRIEKAEQDLIQLGQQQEENSLNIIRGRMAFAAALVSEDPRQAAIEALKQAEFELAHATGEADREAKNAAVVQAQKALNNTISAGISADAQLAIGLANLRGDTVTAANEAAKEAKRLLAEAQAKNITDRTVLAPLEQQVAETAKAQFLAPIQKQISDLDYLYGIEQISLGEYISLLETELSRLTVDTQEYKDLKLKIFGLKKSASADLGWSLPGSLTLPTLYETRRANQTIYNTPATPYQDNRNVQVNIAVNGAQDPVLVAQQVQTALNDSLRGGQTYTASIPVAAGI